MKKKQNTSSRNAKARSSRARGWPIPGFDDLLHDEQHMAHALYQLTRAVAGRYMIPDAEMHGLLRAAAMHCEAARQRWTKEGCQRIGDVAKIFEEPSSANAEVSNVPRSENQPQ